MKNLKNFLLASALLAVVCVPAWSMAQENQDVAPLETTDAIGVLLSLDVFDASFARYVCFSTLSVAWENQNPVLLADCALELAEAERVLMRTLNTLTSEALLDKAIALAVDQGDTETIDRIIRFATARNKEALLASATTARRLAGAERVAMPALTINLLTTPWENIWVKRGLIYHIDRARANGNRAFLTDFVRELGVNTQLNNALPRPEVESIIRYAQASERVTAESSDEAKETEYILDRLVGEERSTPPHPPFLREIMRRQAEEQRRREEEQRRREAEHQRQMQRQQNTAMIIGGIFQGISVIQQQRQQNLMLQQQMMHPPQQQWGPPPQQWGWQ